MKISTAKQGIICALVMAVTAPDEKSSKAVLKKLRHKFNIYQIIMEIN